MIGRSQKRMRRWVNKPKTGSRARLKRDLHDTVSDIVIARDKCCVICGRTDDLQTSHFYKRGWPHTAFDLRNVHAMCGECNRRHNVNQWPYVNYMLSTYGDDVLTELFELKNRADKIDDATYAQLLSDYKMKLKEMKEAA